MEIFKVIVDSTTSVFKQNGFRKKLNNFYIESSKNYAVVNFQKSKESTKQTTIFTINFGVYSNVLGQFEHRHENLVMPQIEQCHWHARIGAFMPGSPDFWWKADISDDISNIVSNLSVTIQNTIIPEINKHISDEDLIMGWMNEGFWGTTEICRFRYLTTLLKAKGDISTLNKIAEACMQKFKGKMNEVSAIEHLQEIGFRI
ncbi:MAG: DUF4304 domain-containing protein [Bacteroidetes bacterium]|nr:DUF4304 domain-containing protein [Bacteroidota bacterium]